MQRPVLLGGAACAALGPLLVAAMLSTQATPYGAWDIVRGLRSALAVAWPFFAVAAGAITFATEVEDRTARFLLSRPVTRLRLWCLKVTAAAATLAIIGLMALLVTRIASASAGADAAYVARPGYSDLTLFTPSTVIGLGLLFFACGVLCSTIVTRPLTAAAAAVALGLALIGVVFTLWAALGLQPNLEPQWLGAEMLVVSALLLVASLLVFARPEQVGIGAPGAAGRSGRGAALALTLLAAALPIAFVAGTPDLDEVSVVPGSISYQSQAVAMAMRAGDGTTQNWLLMTDGSGARLLTGRHTLAPHWPAGNTLVAYFSRRGVFGNDSDALELRITDVFGTMSWTAVRDMPGVRELFFDAYGPRGRVAFTAATDIVVAELDGTGRRTISTSGTPLDGATLLGFNGRGALELFLATGDLEVATAIVRRDGSLMAYDLDTNRTRNVARLEAGSVLPALLRNAAPGATEARGGPAWNRAPVPLLAVERNEDGSAAARLLRVHPGTGATEIIYQIGRAWTDGAGRAELHRCAAVEYARDRRWQTDDRPPRRYSEPQVLFGDCSAAARAEFPAGAVRLIGGRTGHVVSWPLPPGWTGRIHRIYPSQRRGTLLLDVRGDEPDDSYAMTLDLDAEARAYPAGWVPLGWTTLDYFLLQREQHDTLTFAVGDARTGDIYDLFPRNELREVLEQRRLAPLAGKPTTRPGSRD